MYIKKFCLTNPTPHPPNRRKTKKERGGGGGEDPKRGQNIKEARPFRNLNP